MCTYIYIYMYVCMYVYIYIYIYTHICIQCRRDIQGEPLSEHYLPNTGLLQSWCMMQRIKSAVLDMWRRMLWTCNVLDMSRNMLMP